MTSRRITNKPIYTTESFKYKGEWVYLEYRDNVLEWVYAYNMKMKLDVVPDDLKTEVLFLVSLKK